MYNFWKFCIYIPSFKNYYIYNSGIQWMLTKLHHIPFTEETKPSWLKYTEHNVSLCNFYVGYPSQITQQFHDPYK